MGVSGCGKSTIGRALGDRLGYSFIDGDALHSEDNIAKMASGQPLADNDRAPWLKEIGLRFAASPTPLVVGCSALKLSYRDVIRKSAGKDIFFLHLATTKDVIAQRHAKRKDHFMPTTLLDSQFSDLEPLHTSEQGCEIDISRSIDAVVDACAGAIKEQKQ